MSKLNAFFENLSEEAIAKIDAARAALNSDEPEVKETQTFVEATLANGTVVSIEPNLEVGATVTAEVSGEIVAAPDGQHELNDGTILMTEGGVITDIQPAAGAEEGEMEGAPEAEERQPKKVITREEIESIFSEQFEAVKAENAELRETVKKLSEGFEAVIEAVGNMPSAKPAETPKQVFKKNPTPVKSVVDTIIKSKS